MYGRGSLVTLGKNDTMDIAAPALAYLLVSISLSLVLTYFTRRPVVSALIVTLTILFTLVLMIQTLPWSIRYYVQDLVYEPIARDIFNPLIETLLSAAFHVGLPVWVVRHFCCFIPERK